MGLSIDQGRWRLNYIKGPMFADIDRAALVADRLRKGAGCNIYFKFGAK